MEGNIFDLIKSIFKKFSTVNGKLFKVNGNETRVPTITTTFNTLLEALADVIREIKGIKVERKK